MLEHCIFFCFSGFLGLATQWHYHRSCTTKAWPSTSKSRTYSSVFFKKQQKLQCSSTYTFGDRKGHVSDLEKKLQCHWFARTKKPERQKKLQCSSTYTSRDRRKETNGFFNNIIASCILHVHIILLSLFSRQKKNRMVENCHTQILGRCL